ncbi:hypothetical protein Tco_0653643 [Tanacetum coccineum]|uniref:DUF4218 domain-containing protein n=1 Tax=Tanacetum coccineum TaxID=301880 RepID=A0ABQ4X0Z2_9ASTR
MDGAVHTYKARLVAKGFTQTYRVDYEETFSRVADIRAIRILIAIAAFYDYEIWQMDVKTDITTHNFHKCKYPSIKLDDVVCDCRVEAVTFIPYTLAINFPITVQLLPYGLQKYLDPDVAKPIIKLCSFFKQICAQTLMEDDMVKDESQLINILCNLEQIYPPTFFDIMIHFHLPKEALEGGPIPYRWMYPFERYMKKLKKYVRNKAKPEGSIAEGYVAEEALNFCSYYFQAAMNDVQLKTMAFVHLEPPYIIVVDDDDDFIDDEDDIPHDLADSDDEFLTNNDDDDKDATVVYSSWAYAFHQDKASSVRVPVANVTLFYSTHLLRENTDSFPLFAIGVPIGPLFLLGLLVPAIVTACASRAAMTLSATSFLWQA